MKNMKTLKLLTLLFTPMLLSNSLYSGDDSTTSSSQNTLNLNNDDYTIGEPPPPYPRFKDKNKISKSVNKSIETDDKSYADKLQKMKIENSILSSIESLLSRKITANDAVVESLKNHKFDYNYEIGCGMNATPTSYRDDKDKNMYKLIINIIRGMFSRGMKYGYYKKYALQEKNANLVVFNGQTKDNWTPRWGFLDKSTELWCNILEYTKGKFIYIYADTELNSQGARFVIAHSDKTNQNKPVMLWSGEDFIFRNIINDPRYNNIQQKINLLNQKINQQSGDLIITKLPTI